VKDGVITVRWAEVYKPWQKGDTYVEIEVVGDIAIGRTPACNSWERNPTWEHTMRKFQFEVGDTLLVRIVGKRSWPNKDLEVARGTLVLIEEIFPRRTIEEDVPVFLSAKGVGGGKEQMASIRLHIDFVVPEAADQKRPKSRVEDRPILWRPGDDDSLLAVPVPPPSRSSRRARPRTLEDEEGSTRGEDQPYDPTALPAEPAQIGDRRKVSFVASSLCPISEPELLDHSLLGSRQIVVLEQYWERGPRPSSYPVLCNSGMRRLLRSGIRWWVT